MRDIAPIFVGVLLSACLEPTQLIVQLETDVPCANIKAFSYAAALPGEVHSKPPGKIFEANASDFKCTAAANGKVFILGTFAVAPKTPNENQVGIDAYLRFDSDTAGNNGHACAPGKAGCIFLPVTISYRKSNAIRVVMTLNKSCDGVACSDGLACFNSKQCQSNVLESANCQKGLCEASMMQVDAGVIVPIPGSGGGAAGSGGGSSGNGGGVAGSGGGSAGSGGGSTTGPSAPLGFSAAAAVPQTNGLFRNVGVLGQVTPTGAEMTNGVFRNVGGIVSQIP